METVKYIFLSPILKFSSQRIRHLNRVVGIPLSALLEANNINPIYLHIKITVNIYLISKINTFSHIRIVEGSVTVIKHEECYLFK